MGRGFGGESFLCCWFSQREWVIWGRQMGMFLG